MVHTPRHARTLAELDDEELRAVATALHARREAGREEGFDRVLIVLNEGRAAGSSLPHSHSQLFWLREDPPEIAQELPQLKEGSCALCSVLRDEALEIAVRGDAALFAAPAGRAPYELLIAPRGHVASPGENDLQDAAFLLREGIRRLRDVEGAVPLNAWFHDGGHWHVELVPRLSVFAGLELGAGIYVNWLPPEEAAARLRT